MDRAPRSSLERLLAIAIKRRIVACACGSSVAAALACMLWSCPLWLGGWRARIWDPVSGLGFGCAVCVLIAAEHVVLRTGYFAARQPWRRMFATILTLSGVSAPLGGVMGACVGATNSHRLLVAAVTGGTVAVWWHSIWRCASQSPVQTLSELDVAEIIRSRVMTALYCAVAAALFAQRFGNASLFQALPVAWHVTFATDALLTVSSHMLDACLLEPLNFEIIAERSARHKMNKASKAIELLLTAIEFGDAGAPDDALLRDDGIKSVAKSSTGWFVAAPREPFDDLKVDAAAPLWRREIEAQRKALWHIVVDIDPPSSSLLEPPPLLSLVSGGLVFGANKHRFELRVAKYLAATSLARAAKILKSGDSMTDGDSTAALILSQNAADLVIARALRACLLIIDSFTLRLEIASTASKQTSANFASSSPVERSRLGVADFDSIATRLRASKFAQKYYFDDATYMLPENDFNKLAGLINSDVSHLEVAAVTSAAHATFPLACIAEHRIPLAMCSIIGARRALWEWRPREARRDLRDLLLCLDATLDRFCLSFSEEIPRFAFPSLYAPDLQRRVDALVNSGRNSSQ